jgi:hypothetical protein
MRKPTTAQLRKAGKEINRALNAREARGCGCTQGSTKWCAACVTDSQYLISL